MGTEKTVFALMQDSYKEAAKPLEERRKALDERASKRTLIAGRIEALQAKQRLLGFDLDKVLSEGLASKADELKNERDDYQAQINSLESESASLISENVDVSAALDAAYKSLAAKVLSQNYPKIREMTVSKVRECVEYLEQAWADLVEYERNTAPCLSINLHRERLTPSNILTDADEKKLADAVEFWFGAGNGRMLSKI